MKLVFKEHNLKSIHNDKGFCCKCGVYSKYWQADHIRPVFIGGGACSLYNLQTLCIDCHKEKTTYNLSHHNAISSQAASIRFIRILYAEGQISMPCLNISNDIQSFGFATSLLFNKKSCV